MLIHLNEQNFNNEILSFNGIAVVDFWADWCGPCKMLGPILEEVANYFANDSSVKVAKVNVDENSTLAQKYGIMSIPALKFFVNGEIVGELIGVQSKETIVEKINSFKSSVNI